MKGFRENPMSRILRNVFPEAFFCLSIVTPFGLPEKDIATICNTRDAEMVRIDHNGKGVSCFYG